ncbi:MAG TPA: glycosyltransferase family 4 protein [Candidatus Kapabacteria bacterium]|nr:glycosyltransferase family 4 protein [Candidatus Kapabacteria bacterium]
MPLELAPRALYAAFDRFPSPKGAATHIARMATTLFERYDGGLLYVLGGEDLPCYQREGNVEILRFEEAVPNYLERAVRYGAMLADLLARKGMALELCHFRDPWGGLPIVARTGRTYRTVYEVNGLPSIELPFTWPDLPPATLAKIRAAERFCWEGADAIITPSHTIAENIIRLGADRAKVTVIPNGADIPAALPPRPVEAPERYILYFGALQRWQGVDVLLNAFARLADDPSLVLVICASTHHRNAKLYRRLASRLGVGERVLWRYALNRSELAGWIAHAAMSVAPLVECSRNIEQGCAPLKILESMAYGVPVVASDLPAVREIVEDGVHGRLVRPDRPPELARAIRVLLEYPERARAMGENGRERIAASFTWQRAAEALDERYGAMRIHPAAENPEGSIFPPEANNPADHRGADR